MSVPKKAAIDMAFLAAKGEGRPVVPEAPAQQEMDLTEATKAALEEMLQERFPSTKVTGVTTTMTTKVDEGRYDRILMARAKLRKTGQDIMIEALDLWLKKNKF